MLYESILTRDLCLLQLIENFAKFKILSSRSQNQRPKKLSSVLLLPISLLGLFLVLLKNE